MSDILKQRGGAASPRLEVGLDAEERLSAGSAGLSLPRFPEPEQRRRGSLWGFLLMVVVPTIIGGIYYCYLAAPQFVTTAVFALRAGDESDDSIRPGGTSLSAGFGPSAGGAPVAQSYGIANYITSRPGLEDVVREGVDVRGMLTSPRADWLVQVPPDATQEALLRAWQRQVSAQFEVTRGTVTLVTRAFTAQDSLAMAEGALQASERLVNVVAGRMHQDALAFAEQQAQRAEERLAAARARLQEFRSSTGVVDAARASGGNIDLDAKLRGDLLTAEAQAQSLRASVGQASPMLAAAEARVRTLRQQLLDSDRQVSRTASDPGGTSWASVVDKQEALSTRVQLAERQYGQTLDLLQQARTNAMRQRSYLLTYVRPAVATEATYPKRIVSTLLVGVCALIGWAVTTLLYRAVRDHA